MLSLYIHIPFCKRKCKYCDFLSFANKEEYFEKYKNALINEINNYDSVDSLTSVFIGGGSPSLFPAEYIYDILDTINKKFNITKNTEITIELNPDTVNAKSLDIYKDCGINRISMGFQAWQDRLLKILGRIHDRETFLYAYDLIRQKGFKSVNIDLMFSLPEQSIEMWQETLENITILSPEHISAYSLIIEEGTEFFEKYSKNPPQSDEDDRKMYYLAIDYLKSKGYFQYEISNFAKKGFESIHNKVYWQRKNYKGFGLGASSMIDNIRYKNTDSFEDYLKGITVTQEEILSLESIMEEFMFLGLRLTEGINTEAFKKEFNKDIYDVYSNQLVKLTREGLLDKRDNRIFLTRRGIDLSNYVFAQFLF